MRKNMNTRDRVIRSFLVAPSAIAIAVLGRAASPLGIVLFAIAGVMLATSAVSFCPLYALLRLDTRGRAPLPR